MLALEKMKLPAEDEHFRNEVREFLASKLTDEIKEAGIAEPNFLISFADRDIALKWQAILRAHCYLGPMIPPEHGGPGWTPLQHFIFESEAGLAGAPFMPGFGLQFLGPVLVKFGTKTQQAELIPRILDGSDYWCQGFSEPGSGSDLANLQCAARRDGDHYIVNGSKMWTTQGHRANKIFCLVRTSREERPQKGISFLLVDMQTPGVTVQPIRLIGGDNDLNQIFFDDVRVPAENLVGNEGEGWRIAKSLLEVERGGFIVSGHCERRLRRMRQLYSQEIERTGPLPEGILIEARLAELDLKILSYSLLELRGVLKLGKNAMAKAQASMLKIISADIHQQLDDLAMDILGPAARYFPAGRPLCSKGNPVAGRDYLQPFTATMLNNRAISIEGGTNEIQRSIIAKELFV